MKTFSMIKEDLIGFWVLATASLCLSLLLNQFRDRPLPLLYASKEQRLDQAVNQIANSFPVSDSDHPQMIELSEMKDFVAHKQGPLLDARPEIFHRLGHIPGALSLPREDFKTSYQKLQSLLEQNRNNQMVVYCSGSSCEDSQMVADSLVKLGYRKIFVFEGGWDAWTGASLPEEKQ